MSVRIRDRPATVSTPVTAAGPPLRIAFLSYRSDPKVGGQGVFVSQAAAALARRGHCVHILSGPPYPDVPMGVVLVRLPSLDLYAQPWNGRRALRWRHLLSWADTVEYFSHLAGRFSEPYTFGRRAAAYLKRVRAQYDVVLDNQSLAQGLLAIDRRGPPVVGIIHHPIRRDLEFALAAEPRWGMRLLIRQWHGFLPMQERVARRLRRLIVVSEASRADVSLCMGVDPEVITAAPIGVDREVFRPQPWVERHSRRILTTASADVPLKGLRYLLEAFADLVRARPDLQLVVVGTLREGPTLKLMESLGLSGKVRFIHDLTRSQMAETYASATIAVTPSLYEGFGLPAAEAMACGTPVVVTDGGALPEVVGEAGVVVPKADSMALARAIGALLDDPGRRAAMSARGVARVESLFCWDKMAARYEIILRQAVATC
jgi:glycosyltransferase involved in cell wall biosynthesis